MQIKLNQSKFVQSCDWIVFLSHFINDIHLFIYHLFVYRFLIWALLALHKDELLNAVLHLLNSSLMLFWNACWTLPLNFQDMHITTATKGQSRSMTSFNSFNHYAWCLQSFNIYKSQGQRRSLTVTSFWNALIVSLLLFHACCSLQLAQLGIWGL